MDEKINLAIVGFQKCATTSIKNYLSSHPDVLGHSQKEMTYFSVEEEHRQGFKKAYKRYYSAFRSKKYTYLLAKHATLIRHEDSIKRLHKHNPEAKIIVCLRNPVQRAFSSYLMELANGVLMQDFRDVIEKAFESERKNGPNWHYNVFIRLGQYVDYIEILQKYFDRKQVYYFNIEEFKQNPPEGMGAIMRWLNLKDNNDINYKINHNAVRGIRYRWLGNLNKTLLQESSLFKKIAKKLLPEGIRYRSGEYIRNLNKRSIEKPIISPEACLLLEEHYTIYNNRLRSLISVDFKK